MSVDDWAIAFDNFKCGLKNTPDVHLLIVYIGNCTIKSNYLITTSDERDCPLNLSISLSGEKENNNDS